LINVFDLNSLKPLDPVSLPPGLYARSIALSNYSKVLATTRGANGSSPSPVVGINLAFGFASAAPSIGIYTNLVDPRGALVASPTGRSIFMPMPDGNVALYDAQVDAFISSRKYASPLSGAYAALSDGLFLAGNHVFNSAMVEVGEVDLLGGESSGATVVDGRGLLSGTPPGEAA